MRNQMFHRCYDELVGQSEVMGIKLTEEMIDRLLAYVQLMHRWNRTYNLTAVRNIMALISRHIIDSFTVLPYLTEGSAILDVGTGAGLPGLPIAIVRPDLVVSLLDSNGKKICFLRQVVSDLGVKNVTVLQQRVEGFQPEQGYDFVVARAFSSLSNLLVSAQHLCAPQGQIIAMKGMYPSAELAEISPPYKVHDVLLPGDEATKRHLVVLEMAGRTVCSGIE